MIDFIKKIRYFVLCCCVMVLSCALPTPIPNIDSEDAKVYVAQCQMCHSLPHPHRHTKKEWKHVLSIMNDRRQEKRMPRMTPQEQKIVLRYLFKHSR